MISEYNKMVKYSVIEIDEISNKIKNGVIQNDIYW